jgi:hypothetical protein
MYTSFTPQRWTVEPINQSAHKQALSTLEGAAPGHVGIAGADTLFTH